VDKLTPLPDWIQVVVNSKTWALKKFKVKKSMKPLECTNCHYKWYPRIRSDGTIELPKACANNDCRTTAWRKIRN